jgi:hypothetical protein
VDQTEDDGVVQIELDEVTERTTDKFATTDWLAGYEAGERKGKGDVLDALRQALREVAVDPVSIEAITEKIRIRSGVEGL